MMQSSIGRYEILSEIGHGGMANVYLANDPRFRRKVAIKLVSRAFQDSPMLRERFEREARLIATIEHPGIVPVYDYDEQDGQLYLVMRYMPGGSLAGRIQEKAFEPEEAARILSVIAPALDAVHARGIVHRDLKPANILLDGFGNPAIADFGIAYLSDATRELTGEAIVGTPSYMSPEQVQSERDIDGRSDIYALGVILFEMLSGQQPYRAATPLGIALKHISEPVPSLYKIRPDLPVGIDAIIETAMAKDRGSRYSTAMGLVTALRSLLDGEHRQVSASQTASPHPREAATETDDSAWQPAKGAEAVPGKAQAAQAGSAQQVPQPQQPVHGVQANQPASISPNMKVQQVVPPIGSGQVMPMKPPVPASASPRPGMRLQPVLALVGIGAAAVFFCGLLLLVATQVGPLLFGNNPTPTSPLAQVIPPEVTPVKTLESAADQPTPVQRTVLASDDFSSTGSGWSIGENRYGVYGYRDGKYFLHVLELDTLLWSGPDITYQDVRISVDATWNSDQQSGYYGLLCRIEDEFNFYYFVMMASGREYSIGKYIDGQFHPLLPGGWNSSDLVPAGKQTSRMQAECSGDYLSLSVDGVKLNEVNDIVFSEGYAGVIAAALQEQAEVIFDNFLVEELLP